MSVSGRSPAHCRAWLDGGYVCGLPRGHDDGEGDAAEIHRDTDTGDVWFDDAVGAHPSPPPGPIPKDHPNYGKPDLTVDADTVTIHNVVTLPRRIAELPPSLLS